MKKSIAGLLGLVSLPVIGSPKGMNTIDQLSSKQGKDVFKLLRKQLLLDKNLVYLNTGSLGPSPRQVVNKVRDMTHKLESNPVVMNWGELGKKMEKVRSTAADFFNVEAEDIILTRNTTEGLSLVGASLKLNKGDEILTTNNEHRGGEVGLEYMAQLNGATLRKIEMPMPAKSKAEIIELIRSSILPNTKVLLLSHVVTITGLRMPVEEISKITREKGILFIVDGAQAPGMIKVDLGKMGADVYATSGHKWLLGPKETGIIYINRNVQERIKPVFTYSGYASYSASSGTRNVATIIGLGEALSFLMSIGLDKIEEQVVMLSNYCREKVSEINGLEVISPSDDSISSAIVSVRCQKANNRDLFQALRNENIIVKLLP
ncbi:MAG: aminotransferase class V-fold PLP-dependent enzyme, partial [Bacteroidota bacterium]